MKLENGDKAKDSVTGYGDTITATITYFEGETQHCVEALATDGSVKTEWFRAGRLVAVQ